MGYYQVKLDYVFNHATLTVQHARRLTRMVHRMGQWFWNYVNDGHKAMASVGITITSRAATTKSAHCNIRIVLALPRKCSIVFLHAKLTKISHQGQARPSGFYRWRRGSPRIDGCWRRISDRVNWSNEQAAFSFFLTPRGVCLILAKGQNRCSMV